MWSYLFRYIIIGDTGEYPSISPFQASERAVFFCSSLINDFGEFSLAVTSERTTT